MKFKRLLATILSALMVMSAFAFTAWAQEEEEAEAELMATGILKEFSGSSGGLGGGMDKSSTKTKYYDAVNDVVFYRFKINDDASGGTFHWNWYTYTINMDTDDNTVNAAYRMRTNKAGAVLHLKVYQAELIDANGAKAGTYNGTSIVGDGNWETAKVAITNSNLKLFKQLHTYLAGTGSHPAGFWFDVAYGTIANDEATAVANVEDATKYASEFDIKFNLNYGESADLDVYPTEIPDRKNEGFIFEGWATKADATEAEVEYTDLTCVAVPTANTTYYAVWGDLIEEENAVYISADGDDANGGRHSQDAVKTLSMAQKIISENQDINTLYIVGSTTPLVNSEGKAATVGFGLPNKKIYIRGYNGSSDVFHATDEHFGFNGDLDFDNITIKQGSGDGKFEAQGHNADFGENVIVTGPKNFSHFYYGVRGNHAYGNAVDNPADATANFNGGSWGSVHFGVWTPGSPFYGKSTINVDKNANISSVKMGHGSGNNPIFYGTAILNVNGGTVECINMNSTTEGAVNSYYGLRYFTLNDGTVSGDITVTSKLTNKDGNLSTNGQKGVTVVEINKIGVLKGNIKKGAADDESARVVIYNNGSYVEGQVTDDAATVIISTDGTIHADVTVASDYAATLNGYTYTTDAANKYININGTNYNLSDFTNIDAATLAEETTVLVPANLFVAGQENVAVFSETPLYEIKWVNGEETVKTETVDGGIVPTAPELTKTGYTLSWAPEVSEASADVTYNAVWTAKEYDVTFNAGDGTFESGKEVTVKATFDSAITAPDEVPTREGYTFAGWTPEVGTLTTEGATFTATWTLNKYTITFNAGDGKFSDDSTVKTVEADHGTTPTAPETPTKDGHTFKEWTPAIEAATGAATYTAAYEKDAEPFPETSTYKTYGYYDALSGTYKIEVKFSGAKVNQGSFGFNFPTSQMTFVSATANAAAGIELFGNASPIYANGEGFYADTWAVSKESFAGNVDATAEEVLIATIDFTMTAAQRTAFVDAGMTLTEYVVASPNAKYHDGNNYLATLYATDFTTTKQAIVYAGHTDEEVTTKAFYTTYGTYDSLREEYTIDIKVKGAKINVGAFGLKFNPAHMTFDPAVDEYGNAVNVTMAPDVANYLGIVLNNTADGYAFVFDGSANSEGYVDASIEEVLIATIKVKMTAEQRTAFENAGKTMQIYVPTANDNITAEELAAYYNGENYLVSLYTDGLEIPRIPAIYEAHNDEVLEVTQAHVEVTVNFTEKQGATNANVAYISLDGEKAALETAGNTATSAAKTYEFLEVGKSYKIRVEKNGYLAAEVNYTVAAGDNKIVIDLVAGDIKGDANASCGDGKIDLSDFVRLIRAFDENASDGFIATVDIDESGAVNVADLAIIKANFNKTSADNTITINGQKMAG